ncbi:MAG: amidohydrolase family protein [Phycisphaerae bacterium]|nr:amidohydrolase family protein [Phycisphaerae bacterium]
MGKNPQKSKAYTAHLVLMILVTLCPACPLFADQDVTAIKGGDLYTITSGIIKNGTILIEDGKISRIGQNIEIPKNAKVINAAGKVVMPGLVTATAEVGMAGSDNQIAESLDPFHYSASLALASGITSIYVSRGGPSGSNPIGGTNAVIKPTYGDLENMLVKESVAQNASLSSWMGKTNFLENQRKAHAYLQKFDEYTRDKDQKKLQELKKPSGIDEYIRLLKKELPARLRATTAAELLDIVEMIDEFDIRVIIDDAVEAWVVAEEIAKHDIHLVITPREKRRPNEYISGSSGSTLENAAILKKAGVKFAIVPTSPSFATWGIAGRDLMALPMEAAFAVSGGLDEQTALESITINAAEIIGVADRVGSLQVGKDADIIILDGHPFHHKTFVELTLINGKILYEKSKSPYFSHITHDN